MGSSLNCVSAQREHGDGTKHHHHLKDHRHRVKILFLDVDGVLNGENYGYQGLDDNLLFLLKAILDETGCKIVLSTTWRLNACARNLLLHSMKATADINVDDIIIGDTPCCKDKRGKSARAAEIAKFLDSEKFQTEYICSHWVAIDDLALHLQDEDLMRDHFVRTNYRTGMTSEDCFHAIQILNESDEYSNSYDY